MYSCCSEEAILTHLCQSRNRVCRRLIKEGVNSMEIAVVSDGGLRINLVERRKHDEERMLCASVRRAANEREKLEPECMEVSRVSGCAWHRVGLATHQ